MNQQPIEKPTRVTGSVQVHSMFLTIQGEGPFAGRRAVFVRLAGCNLRCPGCDTDYTSDRRTMTHQQVADEVHSLWQFQHDHPNNSDPLIVITGGEPFRQGLALLELVEALALTSSATVQIETNGTLATPAGWSFLKDCLGGRLVVVCSPKTNKLHIGWDNIDAVKYVMRADAVHDDGLPVTALDHPTRHMLARPPLWWNRTVYLQPMDAVGDPVSSDVVRNTNARNLRAVVESCIRFDYTLCIQLHKVANVP